MDTLYTFWDNIIHYKTESAHVLGLMNSATKRRVEGSESGFGFRLGIIIGFRVASRHSNRLGASLQDWGPL